MKVKAVVVLVVACSLFLGGCGGGGGSDSSSPTVIPPVIDCGAYWVRETCNNSFCNEPPVVGTCPESCPGPNREYAIITICGLIFLALSLASAAGLRRLEARIGRVWLGKDRVRT